MHKAYYMCNICIETYTSLTALGAQILMGSEHKSEQLNADKIIIYSFC